MHTFVDSALNAIDRVSNKFSPLNSLLDVITNRLLPNATVQACSGYLCYDTCADVRCSHYDTAYRQYWSATVTRCVAGDIWCTTSKCGGC